MEGEGARAPLEDLSDGEQMKEILTETYGCNFTGRKK